MIELDYRRWGIFKSKLLYFGEYLPTPKDYHFITVSNCYIDLPQIPPYKKEQRHTVLIDISRDPQDLLKSIPRRRRKIIRRSLDMGFQTKCEPVSEKNLKEFRKLYNQFIAPKTGRKLLTVSNLLSLSPYLLLFSGLFNNHVLCMQLVIHNGNIARGLMAVRNEKLLNIMEPNISYFINTYFQYQCFIYFNNNGYKYYDMGGIDINKETSACQVTNYKLSWGGEIVPTYYYEAEVTKIAKAILGGFKLFKKLINAYRQ
jgi:lipid II:glycine glycyltransferase (peptidoglycan interpeptide bridge formation enzyme)